MATCVHSYAVSLSKPHIGALYTDAGPSHQPPSFDQEDESPDCHDSMDNASFPPYFSVLCAPVTRSFSIEYTDRNAEPAFPDW